MNSLGLNLSIKLRKTRESKGKTQQWLADKMGLARATINKWENNGAGGTSLDELESLAKHLEISLPGLLELNSGHEVTPQEALEILGRAINKNKSLDPPELDPFIAKLAQFAQKSPDHKLALESVLMGDSDELVLAPESSEDELSEKPNKLKSK